MANNCATVCVSVKVGEIVAYTCSSDIIDGTNIIYNILTNRR